MLAGTGWLLQRGAVQEPCDEQVAYRVDISNYET